MSKPKILSVRIERKIDDNPDFSFLGEYGDCPETDWAIDRKENGDWERGEYRFWNPGPNHVPPGNTQNWEHVSEEAVKDALRRIGKRPKGDAGEGKEYTRHEAITALDLHYIQQDYERCESYNRGDWCYLGIIAKAEVRMPSGTVQTIRSGGLWGVESDSDASYIAEVENEELEALRTDLEALGIGERAIAYALKRVERED